MNDYVYLPCLDDYISFALSVLLIIPGGQRLIVHQSLGCDTISMHVLWRLLK